MARGLKVRIQEIEGFFCIYSENKGANQLCDYGTADLHLCFHICKSMFSGYTAHFISLYQRPVMLTGTAHLAGTASLDCASADNPTSVLDMTNQSADLTVPCIPATASFIELPV